MAEKLASKAILVGAIKEKDREIYVYSYQMFFMQMLMWGSALVIGLLSRQLLGMVVFLICFVPLREYAGGIHVKSKWVCYAGTILVFALAAGIPFIPIFSFIRVGFIILLPVSVVALFILAPQEDENKPASPNEYRHFKRLTRIIIAVEVTFIVIVILMLHQATLGYFCLFGFHLCAALVVIKALENRIKA